MSGLVDRTQLVLGQALDGLTRRQTLISSNLSNIDTPGYQPQAIDFETALQQEVATLQAAPGNAAAPAVGPSADVAMRATDARHFGAAGGFEGDGEATTTGFDGTLRNDGNRVDIESEMTALTETQIKYTGVARLMNGKFDQLMTVIGGR